MEKLAAYVVREGALSAEDAVGWLVRLAATLEPIHARGGAHGRVSAKAIHVHRAECVSAAYLLDSADLADEPSHFSVERTFGGGRSPADDCWAVGVTLYCMLTGVLPYPGGNADEVRKRLLGPPPAPLAVYDVGDDHIQAVLDRMLARQHTLRVTSMGEIRELLVTGRPHLAQLPPLYYGRPEDIIHDEDSSGDVVTTTVYNLSGSGDIAEAVREAQRRLQGATVATATPLQTAPRSMPPPRRPPTGPPTGPPTPPPPAPPPPPTHPPPARPPPTPPPAARPPPARPPATPPPPSPRAAIRPPPEHAPAPPSMTTEARRDDQPQIEVESVDVLMDTGSAIDVLDRQSSPRPGLRDTPEPDPIAEVIPIPSSRPAPPMTRESGAEPELPLPLPRSLFDDDAVSPLQGQRPTVPQAPQSMPRSEPTDGDQSSEEPPRHAHVASLRPRARRLGISAYVIGGLCVLTGAAIAFVMLRPNAPTASAAGDAASISASASASASGPSPAPSGSASSSAPRPAPARGDVVECMLPLFPDDTFSGRVPDLEFVCSVEDPLVATRQLRSQVVLAGGGDRGVTSGMRELNTMGWYALAAFAVARGRCCSLPPPLRTPTNLSSCDLDNRLERLGQTANAADNAAAEAALVDVTEAFNCLARGGSAAFFGQTGMPQGGELTVFMQTFARARKLASR